MMRQLKTEIAVIGAGTAGLTAYRRAKARKKQAVLIEGGVYGTTCARVGCMPSKLLIAAANAAYQTSLAPQFGIQVPCEVEVDGKAVMERVRSERDRFVGFVLDGVKAIPEEDRIRGYARFLDDHRLLVGDDLEVTAERIVIATGSTPFIPDILKGAGDRLLVNDDVFEWTDLPESIAVFGIGVIGLELGQALSRLGVRTHLFGLGGFVGSLTDPMVLDEARKIFCDMLDIDFDADVRRIYQDDGEVVVEFLDKTTGDLREERYEYLLAASGRIPNLEALDLHNTTLQLNPRGVPFHDITTMQCGDHPIFIAGDATNESPLLHEADDEGVIAGENAANWPDVQPGHRRSSLSILFSDPEIIMVGQRYAELEQGTFVVGAVNFDNQGRSRVMLKNKGVLHVYADKDTQLFLGAEMIGPDAEHVAHLLAWCHQMEMTIPKMLSMPFYHPVIEEGIRTALRDAFSKLAST